MLPQQQLDELRRRTEEVLLEAAQARALVAETLARSEELFRRTHWVVGRARFLEEPPKPLPARCT